MAEHAYVTSDLHLGGGKVDPQLEDFFQDASFEAFLVQIRGPETTLFINGDFIDFAQIPPYEVPSPNHLLWTEDASLEKLKTALAAHAPCFDALAAYLATGARLVVLIGNHDLDLAWPKVQAQFRAAVGSPPTAQLRFTAGVEQYHGVLIEHGHAFTPENCPADTWNFIHTWTDPQGQTRQYLERVWGTDFMLNFYNELERTHSFADNVKPMASVMFKGLKSGWVGGEVFVRFVLFLKRRGIPWQAIASSVLDGEAPATTEAVLAGVAEHAWRQVAIERAAGDPAFVREIEDALAHLSPADQRVLGTAEPAATNIERPELVEQTGGQVLGLIRDGREERAAKQWLAMGGITAVVFGHTHEIVDGALGGCLYNPGTWIPHLDLKDAAVRAKIEANGLTLDMLNDKSLYVVERRAVHLIPDGQHRTRTTLFAF